MGLRETIADEQACALLTCVPAAGLLHGAVGARVQDYRWVRPSRFSEEQLRALGSCQAWHPGLFRQMARTTAGICIECETDGMELAVELRVDGEPKGTRSVLEEADRRAGSSRLPHDGLSAEVDDRAIACSMPDEGEGLYLLELAGHDPEDELGLQPLPGMGRTRHVRIWLPALRGCEVRDVYTDGSFVRPVAHRSQLLVLGDSIVQGFVADDPAHSWPALLAKRLGLDLVNQGVGGQVFQPGSLFGLAGSTDPARIIVAFGENYRYEPCVARRVSADVRSYLGEVSRLWPDVPTHVLTPLWHDEEAWPSHRMSCHEQVPDIIRTQASRHEQMRVIDGSELLDHDPELLADGYEHPNERGCRQIASRLNAVIRVPGLRPSSVGRRRKKRRRPAPQPQPEPNTIQLPLE